ncbi:MAG: acyl-CoA dehydrogenase [Desulfomonilaceae bacterium]|nr:acyl-CoA dehydrogenase [Desulfomonilaceae bacterium]
MNFDWTDQERSLRTRVAEVFDESARQELDLMEDAQPSELKEIVSKYLKPLAGTGYLELAVGLPDRGGMTALIAAQELPARISGSLFLSVEVTARIFAGLLSVPDAPEQIREILEAVSKGEIVGAAAVTEPALPDSAAVMTTAAWPDGDHYLVSGRKDFVTNGPIADYTAVVGLVEENPAVFVVEAGSDGLLVGPRIRTLGYNGLAVSSLELNECRVPRSRVLGPFTDGAVLDGIRLVQDLILAVASVGLMQRTTDAAKAYSRSHERGGKPVAAHQEIRFKLAEMLTLTHAAQLLTHRAGWMYAEAEREAETLVRCAKVFAAEASERTANLAMQILAGQGYVWGNVVERGYREAKYAALAGTTSEIARMSIADDLLTRYR